MENYCIYGLLDNGEVFYVGVTKNKKNRERDHKSNYGQSIVLQPIIELQCSRSDAREIEGMEIAKCRKMGIELLNDRAGGGKKTFVQSKVRAETLRFIKNKMVEFKCGMSETIDILLYDKATL